MMALHLSYGPRLLRNQLPFTPVFNSHPIIHEVFSEIIAPCFLWLILFPLGLPQTIIHSRVTKIKTYFKMTTGIKAFLTFLISFQLTGIFVQTSVLKESESDEVDMKTGGMLLDFNKNAHIKLSSLSMKNSTLFVEIWFMVRSKDGTLLYNGQKQKGTNSIVIDVADGYVCFRCKIGNEILIDLKSKELVSNHEWHAVIVQIKEGKGYLQVDHEDIITSKNSKPFTEVETIGEALYIGGNPNSNDKNGLDGAIQYLEVNRDVLTRDLIVMAHKMKNVLYYINNPCKTLTPCENVKCITKFGQYSCCTGNNDDLFCPIVSNHTDVIVDPSIFTQLAGTAKWRRHDMFLDFNVNSYLQLPTPEKEWFSVEIVFMTRSSNGTLLYNGQFNNGTGDFMSIIVKDSKVQLRYNFGNNLQILISSEISHHEWHVVRVNINRISGQWIGTIQVDPQVGSEQSKTNLDPDDWDRKGPLYVGSYVGTASQEASVEYGLNGAIMRMSVNDRPVNLLADVVEKQNVLSYSSRICSNDLCKNGGRCIKNMGDFMCDCHDERMGTFCQTIVPGLFSRKPLYFDGFTSYIISKRNLVTSRLLNFIIEFSVTTTKSDGLILQIAEPMNTDSPSLSISVKGGLIKLINKFPEEKAEIVKESKQKVDNGRWHKIHVHLYRSDAMLNVDPVSEIKDRFTAETEDNANSAKFILQLGAPKLIPSKLSNFVGYIKDMKINNVQIEFKDLERETLTKFPKSSLLKIEE